MLQCCGVTFACQVPRVPAGRHSVLWQPASVGASFPHTPTPPAVWGLGLWELGVLCMMLLGRMAPFSHFEPLREQALLQKPPGN